MFRIKRYLKRDIVKQKMIVKNILTITELAAKIDMSPQYLSRALSEKDPINISEDAANRIAKELDCEVNEIIKII